MMEGISIVSLDQQERWEAALSTDGLPSHSWGYARALRDSGIEPELAVVRSGGSRMLLPFFAREWAGTTDIATVPGLSGASIDPASPAPLATWRRHAEEQGWIAGYIQLAPGCELVRDDRKEELGAHNEVYLLDLRQEDPLSNASEIVRRKIRRAERSGATLVEDLGLLAGAVVELHPQTMRRVGASSVYDFSSATLESWTAYSGSLALGARLEEKIEAVTLFVVRGPRAEFLLNGSTDSGRELAAWLFAEAIPRLRERGVEWLNLGGGIRPGDGVAQFKQRFRPEARPLRRVRQIYDESRYAELCARAGVGLDSDWFPAYRSASA